MSSSITRLICIGQSKLGIFLNNICLNHEKTNFITGKVNWLTWFYICLNIRLEVLNIVRWINFCTCLNISYFCLNHKKSNFITGNVNWLTIQTGKLTQLSLSLAQLCPSLFHISSWWVKIKLHTKASWQINIHLGKSVNHISYG